VSSNIVPFGKYKGQPVEVLSGDPGYVEWLQGQPWVKDRFGGFYQLIINNFKESDETPEHNKLQVLFLDDVFCAAFIDVAYPGKIERDINEISKGYRKEMTTIVSIARIFEVGGIDCCLSVICNGMKLCFGYDYDKYGKRDLYDICIEIKPQIGDDYPAVLRQMRKNESMVLFVDRFYAEGATVEQFIKTFELSGIKVVFKHEVEAMMRSYQEAETT
jgi:hypothetical protein